MQIDGRRFPWVFRTWSRIREPYVAAFGFDPMRHAWGVRLYWNRRDWIGETVAEGETRFASRIEFIVPVYLS